MKIRFIIENTFFMDSVIEGDKPIGRTHRLCDDTEIANVEKAEDKIKELIDKYNKEEKRRYGKKASYRKLLRIIDEEKLAECSTELIWDSYQRQELQGECVFCSYKFVDFFNRGKQQKEDFKYCHGFGQSRVKKDDLIIVFECPECFEKTYFHCNDNWYELYGEWIVDESIFLKESGK